MDVREGQVVGRGLRDIGNREGQAVGRDGMLGKGESSGRDGQPKTISVRATVALVTVQRSVGFFC